MLSGNFAEMTTSTPFRDLLHAANLRRDRRLYFPSEGRRAEDFFALKNPKALAGFEPANLGTKGQHAIYSVSYGEMCTLKPRILYTLTTTVVPIYSPHRSLFTMQLLRVFDEVRAPSLYSK